MIIVHNKEINKVSPKHICLVFGAGLIGGRVIASLQRGGLVSNEYHKFSWDQGAVRERQLKDINTRVDTLLESINIDATDRVSVAVLWSAGYGGFATSEDDLITEVISFRRVLEFADRLFTKHSSIIPSFHMLSSAGGLFEGQTNVGLKSPLRPQRAYGRAKLEQENLLNAWDTRAAKYCYRPSSVYGLPFRGQRMGLIPTLLQNGMQRRVVNFFGGMDTKRDYVAVEDIAHFIATKIRNRRLPDGIFTLASAQTATLYQLKVTAERCIQRKIFARFELNPENVADNSFLASVLPLDWRPTPVATGLLKLHSELLQGGMISSFGLSRV